MNLTAPTEKFEYDSRLKADFELQFSCWTCLKLSAESHWVALSCTEFSESSWVMLSHAESSKTIHSSKQSFKLGQVWVIPSGTLVLNGKFKISFLN